MTSSYKYSIWQPSASFKAAKRRAHLYQTIRDFFSERYVLEVETPLLSSETVTDPHIQSFVLKNPVNALGNTGQYLQSSPEFCMKRLLASGFGDIYQICKAFRAGEFGGKHNPEFTMLEWYRVGWSLDELIAEVVVLLSQAKALDMTASEFTFSDVIYKTYAQLFSDSLGMNPHLARLDELQEASRDYYPQVESVTDKAMLLDLLMTHVVEPTMQENSLYVVTEFPGEQAALAKTKRIDSGYEVACRFEVYYNGVELANGYDELQDAAILAQRFKSDADFRNAQGIDTVDQGSKLLQAMQAGLPECVGVAMGLDRLLMLMLGSESLSDVLQFPANKA